MHNSKMSVEYTFLDNSIPKFIMCVSNQLFECFQYSSAQFRMKVFMGIFCFHPKNTNPRLLNSVWTIYGFDFIIKFIFFIAFYVFCQSLHFIDNFSIVLSRQLQMNYYIGSILLLEIDTFCGKQKIFFVPVYIIFKYS